MDSLHDLVSVVIRSITSGLLMGHRYYVVLWCTDALLPRGRLT